MAPPRVLQGAELAAYLFLEQLQTPQKRHAFSGSGSPSQNPKRVLLTGCVNKLKPFQKKEPSERILFSGNSELAVRPKHEFVLSFHVYMKTSPPLTFWW